MFGISVRFRNKGLRAAIVRLGDLVYCTFYIVDRFGGAPPGNTITINQVMLGFMVLETEYAFTEYSDGVQHRCSVLLHISNKSISLVLTLGRFSKIRRLRHQFVQDCFSFLSFLFVSFFFFPEGNTHGTF